MTDQELAMRSNKELIEIILQLIAENEQLKERLGDELFLEVLGCCSLANMLCRLGVVVDADRPA